MKRILALLLSLVMLSSVLAGCGGDETPAPSQNVGNESTPAGESQPSQGGQTQGEATASIGWETYLLLEADDG